MQVLAALGRTHRVSSLVDRALRTIRDWRMRCERPAVSCSGGKDSTALLLLTLRIDPRA